MKEKKYWCFVCGEKIKCVNYSPWLAVCIYYFCFVLLAKKRVEHCEVFGVKYSTHVGVVESREEVHSSHMMALLVKCLMSLLVTRHHHDTHTDTSTHIHSFIPWKSMRRGAREGPAGFPTSMGAKTNTHTHTHTPLDGYI